MILYYKEGQWLNEEHTMFTAILLTDYFNTLTEYNLGTNTDEYREIIEKGYIINDLPKPVEPTDEDVKTAVINAVQAKLDEACKTKGYDNGFACASYASSTVETFKNEANAFITWRDACWVKCYSLLEQYQRGLIERPTVEQVLNSLPNMEWA